METLTYGSGRASGCDSPGLLNKGGITTKGTKAEHKKHKTSFLCFLCSPFVPFVFRSPLRL